MSDPIDAKLREAAESVTCDFLEHMPPEPDSLPTFEELAAELDRILGYRSLFEAADQYVATCKELEAERDTLVEERDRLTVQLEVNRKIRAYVAFVLADDEEADVQLAADRIVAERDALLAELEAIRALSPDDVRGEAK